MPRFRKKPVVIVAFRFLVDSIPDWFLNNDQVTHDGKRFFIKTLEGTMSGGKGDWHHIKHTGWWLGRHAVTHKEIKLTPKYVGRWLRIADAAENYVVKCGHGKHCSSLMALKLPAGQWLITNDTDKLLKNRSKCYNCDCGYDELKQALKALKTVGNPA